MTAPQLLILIGILAIIRGIFLLLPYLQVRSAYLKLALVAGWGGAGWYFLHPDVMERVPHPAKLAVLAVAFLAILFAIPGGMLDERQKKTMLEYMDSVIIAGATALVLIAYVIRSFYIPSQSMEDTLLVNDMILVNETVYHFYNPARGDVIVFHPPPKAHSEGKDYIKRVVAVGGDTISLKNDVVYINGQPSTEPYKNLKNKDGMDAFEADMDPVTVPPGNVFVMGDNRYNSQDSRAWDFLPVQNVIGKAFVIFYPLPRVRLLR